MSIDELFQPSERTASEKLKTKVDNQEELAVGFDEINIISETDTLMTVDVYCAFTKREYAFNFVRNRALSFRKSVLDAFGCIQNCSRILFSDGDMFSFDATIGQKQFDSEYMHITFAFKRQFSSSVDIIKLMNATWGWFSMGAYCNITFYTRTFSGIFNGEPLTFTFMPEHHRLYLERKKKTGDGFNNQIFVLKDQMLGLVYLVSKLMVSREDEIVRMTSMNDMMTMSYKPDFLHIKPYDKLCEFFGTNLYETNFVDEFFKRQGVKDHQYPFFDCKSGYGMLQQFDGYVLINSFCSDFDGEFEFGLLSPRKESFSNKLKLNIDASINKQMTVRNILSRATDKPDYVNVRQVSIYRCPKYERFFTPEYIMFIRLAPAWIDDAPTEILYIKKISIFDTNIISPRGIYISDGEKLYTILGSYLGYKLPDLFIKQFDYALERVQSEQLKQQILYHGREH